MRRRQEVELAPNHHTPPWATDDRTAIKQRIGAIGREKGGPAFRQWVSEQSPLDLTVYSDGSLSEDGSAGAGFCVYRGTQEIARGQVPLGHTTEVYDAEIEGALAGVRAALAHYMARFATKLTVCLDNEEAALRLHSGTPTDSNRLVAMAWRANTDVPPCSTIHAVLNDIAKSASKEEKSTTPYKEIMLRVLCCPTAMPRRPSSPSCRRQ